MRAVSNKTIVLNLLVGQGGPHAQCCMVAWCHDEVLLGKETAEAFGAEMSSPPTV